MRHTPETKAKLSAMRTGSANPFYGRKHTAEALAKMSESSRHRNLARTYEPAPQSIVIPGPVKVAYIAGLIDADGSIRFSGGRPFIAVYNTCRPLIDWLMTTLQHGSVCNGNLGREQVLAWRIQAARDVFALGAAIRPLLIVKASDCDAALDHLREKYAWD